jgi:hypothetical protein
MNKILLAVFLAAVLLTAGCNGTNTQQSNNGGNTQTTAAAAVTQPTSSGGGSAQTTQTIQTLPTTQTTAVSSGGALDDIKGLLGMGLRQYMVVYQMTFSGQNQPGYSGTMTYYLKSDGKVRTDTSADQMETRIYVKAGSATSCTKQGEEWACYIIPVQQDQTDVGKNLEDAKNNIDTSPVTPLPDRVLAGVNCKCFKMTVTTKAPQEIVWDETYCLSPEGVPLYTEAKSASLQSVMTATKYSTQVSDADFVPPAEPQDLSKLMQGAGGGRMPNLEDLKKGLPDEAV